MARQARGEVIDPSPIQVLPCVLRCVQRAFLCGDDPYSGMSSEHRREWFRERLEYLASIFAIDCLTYTVLSHRDVNQAVGSLAWGLLLAETFFALRTTRDGRKSTGKPVAPQGSAKPKTLNLFGRDAGT